MITPRRIFLSVAEDSADIYAAQLVRAARERLPQCRFYGLTGPRTQSAGVESLFDLTAHAAMLTNALALVARARRALFAVESEWRRARPDLVVLLDSPELNLRLARLARRFAAPVLYYIAPQTWAAREGRTRALRETVDRLACILPFEEDYFRRAGVRADFVGHPLFEALARERAAAGACAAGRPARPGGLARVGLLPGSRRHVVESVLPLQLEVVRRLHAGGARFDVGISAASEARAAQIAAIVRRARRGAGDAPEPEVMIDDNARLLSAADLVLVASGTATLHVACYRKPMIVLYDAGPLLAALHRPLGRFFLKTPHLALVNVLAGARIVPEFMPHVPDVEAAARVAGALLTDEAWRGLMVSQLDALVRPLESSQASARVCGIIEEMLPRG